MPGEPYSRIEKKLDRINTTIKNKREWNLTGRVTGYQDGGTRARYIESLRNRPQIMDPKYSHILLSNDTGERIELFDAPVGWDATKFRLIRDLTYLGILKSISVEFEYRW